MKNIYILHGCCDKDEYFSQKYPSPSNFHWFPWLQKQLLMAGHNCQTPELPAAYKPDYPLWKKVFSHFPIDSNTCLIAHSCGCGFLLRYLQDTNQTIDKLIMVAPWLDPYRTRAPFLDFTPAPELENQIKDIHILYSEDESVEGVKESVDVLLNTYKNAKLHTFKEHGHFCLDEMGTEAFPELLEVIMS